MDTLPELLAYFVIFMFYAIGGACMFDLAVTNLKLNRNFRAGLWFMVMIWYIIGLAYIRFKY